MITSVVGSFPVVLKKPDSFSDKLLNVFKMYDPYKLAIKDAVTSQLDAGIDVVSDGQVRGDMVSNFSKFIPGFKYENNSSVIVSKINRPYSEITTHDIKIAKSVLNNYFNGENDIGVKGIITGPSTLVHSSRIESFYKNKDQPILDLAKSLNYELQAIDKLNVKYIQIDEPFLSTGMVDLKTASKAIDILTNNISSDIAMHVCGNLENIFTDLLKFNVDILDCEFAANDKNIGLLEKNANNLKNKKIGFGCLDTTLNKVDDFKMTKNLVSIAVDICGVDNLILDPDCGLKKLDSTVAFEKLKLLSEIKNTFV